MKLESLHDFFVAAHGINRVELAPVGSAQTALQMPKLVEPADAPQEKPCYEVTMAKTSIDPSIADINDKANATGDQVLKDDGFVNRNFTNTSPQFCVDSAE